MVMSMVPGATPQTQENFLTTVMSLSVVRCFSFWKEMISQMQGHHHIQLYKRRAVSRAPQKGCCLPLGPLFIIGLLILSAGGPFPSPGLTLNKLNSLLKELRGLLISLRMVPLNSPGSGL